MLSQSRTADGLAPLLQKATAELEQRLRAGEGCRAEDFLAALPDLLADLDAALELIYTEFVLRMELEQKPSPAEYYQRFPAWEDRLRRLFEVHQAVCDNPAGAAGNTATFSRDPYSPHALDSSPGRTDAPRRIGSYELLGEIGRGGMGVVYKARQAGLDRIVALKMILAGPHAGPEELSRFRSEALAVARLHHPNIVQIYEVGDHDGHPYLALEYVDGGSLAQRLDKSPQPARPAAALIEILARAVHHAHERGIIHRDLKPANILLAPNAKSEIRNPKQIPNANEEKTTFETRPAASLGSPDLAAVSDFGFRISDFSPKVSDFGLAKRLGEGSADQTRTGAIVGTPSYMAPEQAGGQNKQVGPATDVYALGALFYEMLTGGPPFRGETAFDTLDQVRRRDPVPPRQLQPRVPRDLETICLKCLRKDPARRYSSAADLAADLERWLNGRPVQARPVSSVSRCWSWCRRNPAVAGLLAALFLVLAGGLAGVTWKWHEADEQSRLALAESAAKDAALADAQKNLYLHTLALAQREWLATNVGRADELLDACPTGLRRWEWHYLKRLCHTPLLTLRGHSTWVTSGVYSSDGKMFASGGADGAAKLWDAATGREIRTFRRPVPVPVGTKPRRAPIYIPYDNCVALSPDGKRLASTCSDRTVAVWNVATGVETVTLKGHTNAVNCVAFSPDGEHLASASADKTLKIWSLATGATERTFSGHAGPVYAVAYSPKGRRLASASRDRTVRIWNSATGEEIGRMTGHHGGPVMGVAFNNTGRLVASTSSDRTVLVWNAASGKLVLSLAGNTDEVRSVAFSPDGKRLAAASMDKTVRIWDLGGGRKPLVFKGHTRGVVSVAFSPDGRRVASTGWDETVRIWDASAGQEFDRVGRPRAWTISWALSADGRRFASTGNAGSPRRIVTLWDRATDKGILTLSPPGKDVRDLVLSPTGSRLATLHWDQTVVVWDTSTGGRITTFKAPTPEPPRPPVTAARRIPRILASCLAAFSPDGEHIASSAGSNIVELRHAGTGKKLGTLTGHAGEVRGLVFSSSGRRLATASADGTLKLWSSATGRLLYTFGKGTFAACLALDHDGKRLATASADKVCVWSTATGEQYLSLTGHSAPIVQVAFSPDGERLVTAGDDRTVRLWDASTGRELLTLAGPEQPVRVLAFSSDGWRLMATAKDGVTTVWDARPR
jgi:WD40 repeat protein/serine/threonine protein kinase